MSSMTMEAADPPLAGALASPGRSIAARWRARRERLMGIPEKAYHQPIMVMKTLMGRFVLISDPAGVKRVLVDNVANYPKSEMEQRFFVALLGAGLLGTDGDLWRRHRRVMAPAFDPRSVAAYGPAIARTTAEFAQHWAALPDGAPIDMAAEMTALTLKIITRTVFSSQSDDLARMIGGLTGDGISGAQDFNLLDIVPIVKEARMRRREARMAAIFAPLDAAVYRLVAEREANPAGAPPDLLSRLVAAKDDQTGAQLTAREVRDEIVTIFLAGHETTAVTMDWIWYVLSQHPAAEARLHAELDAVLAGRTPGQEDLAQLPYTRRIVEETMRLFPAAPGLSTRQAVAADEICGHAIAKGDNVGVAPWVLHRHRRLWNDPERFEPDRFSPEGSAGRPRFAYLPFGAGPRVCIGQVLAMNEAMLILAALAQHHQPRMAPGFRVGLQHDVTLRPRNGLKMLLERRAA